MTVINCQSSEVPVERLDINNFMVFIVLGWENVSEVTKITICTLNFEEIDSKWIEERLKIQNDRWWRNRVSFKVRYSINVFASIETQNALLEFVGEGSELLRVRNWRWVIFGGETCLHVTKFAEPLNKDLALHAVNREVSETEAIKTTWLVTWIEEKWKNE